jgi:hypothetical protein
MAAETATNGAVVPPKRKMGRPVGYPKSGGRRKGPESKIGKEGREWLAKNSKVLDLLARVAAGKPVRVANKAGHKPKWHYPTFTDQKWACEQLLPRLVPTLSSSEVSGPDGAPITTQALLPMEAMQRFGALIAAHQAQQPAAPPGEPAPPVIDVEPEPIDGPEKREEGAGGRESGAPAGCADD